MDKSDRTESSDDILKLCENAIRNDLEKIIKIDGSVTVKVIKRNKDLSKGDFISVIPKWKKNENAKSASGSGSGCHIHELVRSLTFASLEPFQASVSNITASCDIYIRLARPLIFHHGISNIQHLKDRYGHQETQQPQKQACINVSQLSNNTDWSEFSMSHLRSLLLSEHVSAILGATGYGVKKICYPIEHRWQGTLSNFQIPPEVYDANLTPEHADEEENINHLRLSIHQILISSAYSQKQQDENDCSQKTSDPLSAVLDLRSFMNDYNMTARFDKNIHLVDFSLNSKRLQDLTILEYQRRNKENFDIAVHVVPSDRYFYQQTVVLGWYLLAEITKQNMSKQIYLVHGPVSSRKGQLSLFQLDEMFRLRTEQMKMASALKYGEIVKGPNWEATIKSLTVAAIKFEMLGTTYKQPVKLDIAETEEDKPVTDKHTAVFVMYNAARISTIISNFEKAVEKGIYPALPKLETLDFGLLREEDEWTLVFNYLLPYPSVIQECVSVERNDSSKPVIQTHKVIQFLQDLSQDLSSYYSRIHVLGEPQPHLFPMMFCRLYLLKALQQVMCNALHLLNITPLSQL